LGNSLHRTSIASSDPKKMQKEVHLAFSLLARFVITFRSASKKMI